MSTVAEVWLGLGSNLAQPARQLATALAWLHKHPKITFQSVSPIYQSPAMLLPGQNANLAPDYLNAVACVTTGLEPLDLLAQIKAQEQRQGRNLQAERWSSRPIDIDILMIDSLCMNSPELTVPHLGIAERDFVLLPWQDLAANTVIPKLGTVADCAAALQEITAVRVADQISDIPFTESE